MNEKVKRIKEFLKEQGPTMGSTAVGATAGVVMGTVIAPGSVEAEVIPEPTPDPVPPTPVPPVPPVPPTPEPGPTPEPPTPEPGPTPEPPIPEPGPIDPPVPSTPNDEVEVLAYERVTNDDGSQVDIAVVLESGAEIAYVDVNLDGIAYIKISDVNGDGEIQDAEAVPLIDQNLSMIDMQNAARFNPLYAQNDMQDYVNDADTDVYMA